MQASFFTWASQYFGSAVSPLKGIICKAGFLSFQRSVCMERSGTQAAEKQEFSVTPYRLFSATSPPLFLPCLRSLPAPLASPPFTVCSCEWSSALAWSSLTSSGLLMTLMYLFLLVFNLYSRPRLHKCFATKRLSAFVWFHFVSALKENRLRLLLQD